MVSDTGKKGGEIDRWIYINMKSISPFAMEKRNSLHIKTKNILRIDMDIPLTDRRVFSIINFAVKKKALHNPLSGCGCYAERG